MRRINCIAFILFAALFYGCSEVNSFGECVEAGYEALEPDCEGCRPYCTTPEGSAFYAPEKEDGQMCADKCGDGNCDEIVCMEKGCPCAETKESCPEDCS